MDREVENMVNGRALEDELKRIDEFFETLSLEEFEEMALDCGAGVIAPSKESMYVAAVPKRYANIESTNKNYLENAVYVVTHEETEAA